MTAHGHETIRALIERSHCEGLNRADWQRLRRELEECEPCQRYFDELATLDRALAPVERELAPVSVDRIWAALEIEPPKKPRQRWARWLWLAPALTAAAALFVFATPQPEFTARGSASLRAEHGLSAFLIAPDRRAVTRASGEVVEIPPGHVVQLALTSTRPGRVGIAGIDAQGELRWYHRTEGDDEPLAVTGDEVEAPVGPAWRIEVQDSPVELWVVEMSDAAALDASALRQAGEPVMILEVSR